MRPLRPGRADAAGFTLLEIVLALSLAALTLTLAFTTVFSLRATLERSAETVQREVRHEQVGQYLERHLRSATLGIRQRSSAFLLDPGAEPLSEYAYRFELEELRADGIEGSRLVWASMAQATAGEGQRRSAFVTLDLRSERSGEGVALTARINPTPFSTREADLPGPEVLLDGLASLRFECYDGGEWKRSYSSEQTGRLPQAVRTVLTWKKGQAVQEETRTVLLGE